MKRVLLAAVCLLASGCAAPPFPVTEMVQEWASYMNRDHELVPGDVLVVTAFQKPELTQEVVVSAEGAVSLKRLEEPVRATGQTVSAFRAAVQAAYEELVPTVEVSVNLKTPNIKSVYVGGEVRRPAAVPWHSNLTISQAIAAAGSFLITAKSSDVLLVRPTEDGAGRSIRINVNEILVGEQADFPLLPGDVVWAQNSAIAQVGDWVELYIRRLLPIGGPGVTVAPL